jgi:hypothetical protein
MHAYERDLHLILTSRPWSLSGSALMEPALKPKAATEQLQRRPQ